MQVESDPSDRFISRPRFGDTVSTLGLKFLYALDQHSSPISLPFRSYSETFGQVVRRYVSAMQPEHALSAQFVVEYLQSKQLIGQGKRLQTYKGDIEQSRPHFRIFPMQTHQMIQIQDELRSLIQESTIHKPELLIPANNITVHVRKPNSQVIDVVVNRYSPLKVLRLEVCKREGLEGGEFSLIFAGKKLEEDEMTLDQLGMEEETMIMLAMVVKLGCFAPNSLITLPGGGTRPVKEIKRGDLVMSLREEDWSLSEDEVVGVHKSMVNCFLRVVLNDGRMVECTPNHKFRSNGRWMAFSKEEKDEPRLREGDRLLKGDLSTVQIVSIERVNTAPVQFFHISTKNNHNFLLNDLPSHNMQVRLLNTANGQQFTVNISQSDTIGLLKLKAEQVVGVAKQQLMIVLNKVQLKDHESIADYIQDIKNCHMLEVVQMAEHTIVVTRLKTKKEHRFKLDKLQEVRELKKLIQAETEVPRDHIILILNNTEMLNAQRIGEFQLHKNFNRVSMVQVGEQQITVSKMMRFQLKKMLYVRVQGNDYLRLNYFSLREMRVEQFLTAFVPDARPSYALLVGPHLLRPTRWLKDIQQLPVFNNEVINCYVIRSYQRLALCPSLLKGPEFAFSAAGLSNSVINQLKGKEVGVKAALGKLSYIHDLKAKFGEGLTAFYQPLQAYSHGGTSLLLENYLQKFACSENPSQLQGFSYCSALVTSLQALPAYVGETHRLLPGLRFREFYQKRGDTICIQSFLSTNASPASLPPRPARNYTILHLKSLRGKPVGVISGVKDEVLFMPLSYFYVERVEVGADFDEAWVVQIPTPLSFDREIFMWVDDEPDSRQNQAICDLLDLSQYELVQLTSTDAAEYWMKEFGWIVKWLGKGIRVMSDMKRAEGPGGNMVDEAGINLVELFHNDLGYTAPIFIYCKNVSAARKAMQARKIAAGRIQKITNDEFELIGFLTS